MWNKNTYLHVCRCVKPWSERCQGDVHLRWGERARHLCGLQSRRWRFCCGYGGKRRDRRCRCVGCGRGLAFACTDTLDAEDAVLLCIWYGGEHPYPKFDENKREFRTLKKPYHLPAEPACHEQLQTQTNAFDAKPWVQLHIEEPFVSIAAHMTLGCCHLHIGLIDAAVAAASPCSAADTPAALHAEHRHDCVSQVLHPVAKVVHTVGTNKNTYVMFWPTSTEMATRSDGAGFSTTSGI